MRDGNRTSLLWFAGDNKLALVNSFFSVPKGCTFRTFNGTLPEDRKRIDYVITRQPRRSLSEMSLFICSRVRTPTTTSCVPESDFPADSLVIENSEPPQGARVSTDEKSLLTPINANS